VKKTDYNIEFAHFYAEEEFGEDQAKSITILKEFLQKLEETHQTYIITILVDEFHSPSSKINEDNILRKFKEYNIEVDYIAYESKFGPLCEKLLQEIPDKMTRHEHFHNPNKQVIMLEEGNDKIGLEEDFEFCKRYTCALLSSVWALSRLGIYDVPNNAVTAKTNKPFQADKIMTILPKKYTEVENKVLDIIRTTKFSDKIKRVEYIFY
jgi:hypothetical protein